MTTSDQIITARMNGFARAETGAVTVDWVVLSAAVVGIGAAVMVVVGDGLSSAGNNTADYLTTMEVGGEFAPQLTSDEIALAMPVDNRSEAWKQGRLDRMTELSNSRLTTQLNRWRNRTPGNSNHSQERIDFEVYIREAELDSRNG